MANTFEAEISKSLKEMTGWSFGKVPDIPRIPPSPDIGGIPEYERAELKRKYGVDMAGVERSIPKFRANIPRPADFCVPLWDGRCLWIEAKKTQQMSLSFDSFRDHQPPALLDLVARQQVTWVLVNFRNSEKKRNKAFAISPVPLFAYSDTADRKSWPLVFFEENALELTRAKSQWDLSHLIL